MKRIPRLASTLCLAGTLLTSCGSPGSNAINYTAYQLTCCTKADTDQTWQPGTTIELHWMVTSTTTTVNPAHKVVVSAVLMGPFSDVNTLKHANGATHSVQGSIITMDGGTPPPPGEVTTFFLPADLPPGYYQLNLKWDFGGGNSQGVGAIVQVGAH